MPPLRLLLAAALALAPALAAGQSAPAMPQSAPAKSWIFFTDKRPPSGEQQLRRVPIEASAHERRARRASISRPELDVPVAEAYLEQLRALGVEPVVRSRWFNAVSAPLTPEQRAAVEALPFVREVRAVARTAVQQAPAPAPAPLVEVGYEMGYEMDYGPSHRQLATIGAIAPLEAGYSGEGVRLGFLDTLFDFEHPALAHIPASGRLLGVEDFTQDVQHNYHGLAVSSVAVGLAEGMLVGPGHGSAVLAATTEFAPTETHQEEDFFVAGMEWMEQYGADVVNVSLGYSHFDDGGYTQEDMDGNTTLVTRAADLAAALGIAVVVSAGNEGASSWGIITAPADADSVIVAGAMRADSSRAPFSSTGPTADGRTKPDVMALGVLDVHATPGHGYSLGSGTSFAAPLLSGVVAQMLQANPDLDPITVRTILRETASQSEAPDNERGWGVVDAEAALQRALALLNSEDAAPEAAASVAVYPTVLPRTRRSLTLAFEAPPARPVTAALYDVLGRRVAVLFEGVPAAGPRTVALPTLSAGVYLWRVLGRDLEASGRIVIT